MLHVSNMQFMKVDTKPWRSLLSWLSLM